MHKYNRPDLPVKDIDYEFIDAYLHYLKVEKHCKTNSAGKYLKELKKITTNCLKRGYINQDPFSSFKIKKN